MLSIYRVLFAFLFSWSCLLILVCIWYSILIKFYNGAVVVLNYVQFYKHVQSIPTCNLFILRVLGPQQMWCDQHFIEFERILFFSPRIVTSFFAGNVSNEILIHYSTILFYSIQLGDVQLCILKVWCRCVDGRKKLNDMKRLMFIWLPSKPFHANWIFWTSFRRKHCLFALWGIELIYSLALYPCTKYTHHWSTTGKGKECQF